jgi:ribonuclease HI
MGSGSSISSETFSHSEYLGTATNNAAELKAILNACNHCLSSSFSSMPYPPTVHIFSDSEFAINALRASKLKAKAHKALVSEMSRAFDQLMLTTETQLIHVPAHVKIPMNELADWAAKRGARGSTTNGPIPIQVRNQALAGSRITHSRPAPTQPPRAAPSSFLTLSLNGTDPRPPRSTFADSSSDSEPLVKPVPIRRNRPRKTRSDHRPGTSLTDNFIDNLNKVKPSPLA